MEKHNEGYHYTYIICHVDYIIKQENYFSALKVINMILIILENFKN